MIAILRKVLTILTNHEKKQWALFTGLTFIISMADITSLAILLYIIHFYTQPVDTIQLPNALFNRSSLLLIILFFIVYSLKNLAAYLVQSRQTRFVHQVASRISRNNMLQYLEGNYSDYIHTDSSVFTRKISLQPLEFCQHVLLCMQQVFTEMALIILSIVAILLFNAKLFLLLLIILLPPIILAGWLTKRKLHHARDYIKNSRTGMWQRLHESISGFVESNIYERNEFFTERYAIAQQHLNQHQSSLQSLQALPARLAEIFAVFGLMLLIAIGSGGYVTLGAFIAAAYKIIPGIARILNAVGQIRTYSFTINDLVQQNRRAQKQPDKNQLPPIFSITFEQIGFSYDHHPILNNFSCQLQPGDLVGIDGRSGKGKSTLLNILLGFISPHTGQIRINQQLVDSGQRKQYWQQIAYVKQQPFFIYDSLLANITLNEQPPHEQRLHKALDMAGVSEWLSKLPAGINTPLTENGKNISGGQRQRVALARALYKEANVLILDEPFSELDEKAEEKLLHHLQQLAAAGRIILLITHNKKSLSFCNKIITL
ncbi:MULTISPECIES: ATP-binding cassette domain-containing protein [Niastella]|uniref:ABC transporter ATP-binding protein n=1 Tax=Niastella soli TaxID=2821487 RepID=A0ABS3YXX7_9BACT|nr:ABC transporter ATP-binding protein [Niastella soli]MBO9202774.1 ABC transporter ATP-binding protein [Niastella soli]